MISVQKFSTLYQVVSEQSIVTKRNGKSVHSYFVTSVKRPYMGQDEPITVVYNLDMRYFCTPTSLSRLIIQWYGAGTNFFRWIAKHPGIWNSIGTSRKSTDTNSLCKYLSALFRCFPPVPALRVETPFPGGESVGYSGERRTAVPEKKANDAGGAHCRFCPQSRHRRTIHSNPWFSLVNPA